MFTGMRFSEVRGLLLICMWVTVSCMHPWVLEASNIGRRSNRSPLLRLWPIQAVNLVYSLYGLMMFALELYSPTLDRVRVVLNPRNFSIPDTSYYRVYAYVIAEDRRDAERLSTHNSKPAVVAPRCGPGPPRPDSDNHFSPLAVVPLAATPFPPHSTAAKRPASVHKGKAVTGNGVLWTELVESGLFGPSIDEDSDDDDDDSSLSPMPRVVSSRGILQEISNSMRKVSVLVRKPRTRHAACVSACFHWWYYHPLVIAGQSSSLVYACPSCG